MTDNHILLYRLAELMLQHEHHILPVDLLFDDEQIGDYVKSIQIDSPYQQMLFEGVLTETVIEEKLFVSFTVEGYFHYVLGEVIYKQTQGKSGVFLKKIVEENKLNGAKEGVEQCLIKDVQKDDLTRLMWLIDFGEDILDVCSVPLAHVFLQIKTNPKTVEELIVAQNTQVKRVIYELLAGHTENDITVLEKSIQYLKDVQKNSIVKLIYLRINDVITPNSPKKATLYVKSIEHIPHAERKAKLNKVALLKAEGGNDEYGSFYFHLGNQYDFIAEYDKAIRFYDKALAIYLKVYGVQHHSTVACHINLGNAWLAKCDFSRAYNYYQEALRISLANSNSTERLNILNNNLGLLKIEQGQYDDAIKLLSETLEKTITYLGKQHQETSVVYHNLGYAYRMAGQIDNSLLNHNLSLNILLNIYGNSNIQIMNAYSNLGMVWENKGDLSKALFFYDKCLKIGIKILGHKHRDVGVAYNSIASIFMKRKEYQKSIEYYKKSLTISIKNNGFLHSDTGSSYIGIGILLSKTGTFDESLKYYKKALKIATHVFGEKHINTATVFNNMATIYKDLGDFKKAFYYNKKALAIRTEILGINHYHVGISWENLGNLWFEMKDYKKSLDCYEKSLISYLESLGSKHYYVSRIYYVIGHIYLEMFEYEKSINNLKKGFEIQLDGSFPIRIAECYLALGNKPEALNYFIQSAEINKEQSSIDDENTRQAVKKSTKLAIEINYYDHLPQWIKSLNNDL